MTEHSLQNPQSWQKHPKAALARERGLQEFADHLWQQKPLEAPLDSYVFEILAAHSECASTQKVFEGVRALLIDRLLQHADLIEELKALYARLAVYKVRQTRKASLFRHRFVRYAHYQRVALKVNGQDFLKIEQGRQEKCLVAHFECDDNVLLQKIFAAIIHTENPVIKFQLQSALTEGYYHFLRPGLESFLYGRLKEQAKQPKRGADKPNAPQKKQRTVRSKRPAGKPPQKKSASKNCFGTLGDQFKTTIRNS